MILWILGLVLVAGAGLVSYYQGALRAAMTLVGLILGAFIAVPVGKLIQPMLGSVGVEHPVAQAFLAPVIVVVLLLIIVKTAAFFLHRQAETYYKYRVSDTQRMLWERMNQRVGLCVGLGNGVMYFFMLSVLAYEAGYAAVQFSNSSQDPIIYRVSSALGRGLQSTGMVKAISAFTPAPQQYYDSVDVLGLIFHNPLLQYRLARYPGLLALAERKEFQEVGNDVRFQQLWVTGPAFGEFVQHEKIAPLLANLELYNVVIDQTKSDLTDLKEYLVTGKSAKYDDEKILGRWDFNPQETTAMARKKPNFSSVEIRRLRKLLRENLDKAVLTATMDKNAKITTPKGAAAGTWKNTGGMNEYVLSVAEGDKKLNLTATVEGNKLLVLRDGFHLVFEK